MGNMQARQEEMEKKLAATTIDAEAGDGAIKVRGNGVHEVLNISIDKDKIDLTDVEELEDLLLVAMNRLAEKTQEEATKISEASIKDMMPPGMDGLAGLFGK